MEQNLSQEITIFQGSKHYQSFLKSLSAPEKIKCDLNSTAISTALYYDLWKIQHSAWQYMIENHRTDRHPISEIAQDLIAFYLKAALPVNYTIELESYGKIETTEKKHKLYVDIVIKKNNKFHFAIEVKTNLGFQRNAFKPQDNEKSEFEIRREQIAEAFEIKESKIIYVLLSPGNVNKEFSNRYWDESNKSAIKVKDRKNDSPFNFIFPLFYNSDPRYYNYGESFDNKKEVRYLSDEKILEAAQKNIVTPLEHIVSLIKES